MNRLNSRVLSGISITMLILLIILGMMHQNYMSEKLDRLKKYNDSIEYSLQYLSDAEALRRDSIANEENMRLSASVLITTLSFTADEYGGLFSQRITDDWEKNIKDLGFEKQNKRVLRVANETQYEYELYDIYGIPYVRTLNGRQITIEPQYVYYKNDQSGERIPEKKRSLEFIDNGHWGGSFKVIFSDSIDYSYFLKTINELGLSKHIEEPNQFNDYKKIIYYSSDKNKCKGYNDKNKEAGVCPDVYCYPDSNLSISIQNNVDC